MEKKDNFNGFENKFRLAEITAKIDYGNRFVCSKDDFMLTLTDIMASP